MTDEKDDVHWITGQELREICADDLSLDKYDEIRKRSVPAYEAMLAESLTEDQARTLLMWLVRNKKEMFSQIVCPNCKEDVAEKAAAEARKDEQRKWRDEHTGDLVWMTPEEEEARIRRDEREKVLDMVLPAFWKYAERLFDDIPTPSWREASNNLEEAIQSLRIPGTQTPVKEREP